MQKYRLFVGMSLPDYLKREAGYVCDRLEGVLPSGSFRFSKDDLWHFTLLFLGDQEEEDLASIVSGLEEFSRHQQAFSGKLGRVDYGPNDKDKKLIWLLGEEDLAKNGAEARDLLQDLLIENNVRFNPENKRFIPHITLARRNNCFLDTKSLPEIKETLVADLFIDKVELISSVLSKNGPEYEVLGSIDLS